jgi:hypothetical protein
VDINEAPFNPETFTNYYWIETTGPISQRNTGSTWNFFAQDAYKPISNLTIRYGFRVDNTMHAERHRRGGHQRYGLLSPLLRGLGSVR